MNGLEGTVDERENKDDNDALWSMCAIKNTFLQFVEVIVGMRDGCVRLAS